MENSETQKKYGISDTLLLLKMIFCARSSNPKICIHYLIVTNLCRELIFLIVLIILFI